MSMPPPLPPTTKAAELSSFLATIGAVTIGLVVYRNYFFRGPGNTRRPSSSPRERSGETSITRSRQGSNTSTSSWVSTRSSKREELITKKEPSTKKPQPRRKPITIRTRVPSPKPLTHTVQTSTNDLSPPEPELVVTRSRTETATQVEHVDLVDECTQVDRVPTPRRLSASTQIDTPTLYTQSIATQMSNPPSRRQSIATQVSNPPSRRQSISQGEVKQDLDTLINPQQPISRRQSITQSEPSPPSRRSSISQIPVLKRSSLSQTFHEPILIPEPPTITTQDSLPTLVELRKMSMEAVHGIINEWTGLGGSSSNSARAVEHDNEVEEVEQEEINPEQIDTNYIALDIHEEDPGINQPTESIPTPTHEDLLLPSTSETDLSLLPSFDRDSMVAEERMFAIRAKEKLLLDSGSDNDLSNEIPPGAFNDRISLVEDKEPKQTPTLTPTGSFADKPFKSFIPLLKIRTNSLDDAIKRKVSQIESQPEVNNNYASELFTTPAVQRTPSLSFIPRSNSFSKALKSPTVFTPSPLSASTNFATPTSSTPNSPRVYRPTIASASKSVQMENEKPKRKPSATSSVPEYLLRQTVASAGKMKQVTKSVNEPVLPKPSAPAPAPITQTTNSFSTPHPHSILTKDEPSLKQRSRSNSVKEVRFGGTQAYYYQVLSGSEETLPGGLV